MSKTKFALHWQADKRLAAGGRWKKIYNGKAFYFSGIEGKSDRLGKDRALEAFNHWKTQQDNEAFANKPHKADYEQAIKLRMDMIEWCQLEPDALEIPSIKATFDRVSKEVRELRSDFAKVSPPPLNRNDRWEHYPNRPYVFPILDMNSAETLEWGR